MKRLKLLTLLFVLFALLCGSADASRIYDPNARKLQEFSGIAVRGAAEKVASPHAEAIEIWDDKVYVLFTTEYHDAYYNYDYEPSEIIEFDRDLNKLRSVKLESGAIAGKNSTRMALYDGKLYVASMGGMQGIGLWGDVWEVNLADMTAKQVLDLSKAGLANPAGAYGIEIAQDGTTYLLTGAYAADWSLSANLFITTADGLSDGDYGKKAAALEGSGYSWEIAYDEDESILWCMAGYDVEARDKSGTLLRRFTPTELGDNIYSIAPMGDSMGLFYTVSNYQNGSVGQITRAANEFAIKPDLVTGLGGNAWGFAFKDYQDNIRTMVREYNYGPNDSVYIWDPSDWAKPLVNASNWASNIHAIATNGRYLYLATYESYASGSNNQDTGEVVRVDMQSNYTADKRYKSEPVSLVDETLPVTPELPAGTPADVVTMAPNVAVSSWNLPTISGLATDNETGRTHLSQTVASKFASKLWDDVTSVVSLPLFTLSAANSYGDPHFTLNDVVAVGYVMSGSDLKATKPTDVKLMKVLSDDVEPIAFTYARNAADFKDGTFTVMKDNTVLTGDIVSGTKYTLVIFIKDNGDFDLNPIEGSIVDPAVIVGTKASSNGDDGGSSGCNAGFPVLGLFALFAILHATSKWCVRK